VEIHLNGGAGVTEARLLIRNGGRTTGLGPCQVAAAFVEHDSLDRARSGALPPN
jgi:hypothetical protein